MGLFNAVVHEPEISRSQSNRIERRGLMDALDASQNLVWFDANGVIVDANPNALKLFAYQEDEMLKQDYFSICGNNARQLMADKRQWARIASGELNHMERSFVGKNAHEVWSSVNFAAIKNENGSTRRVLALFIDMGKFAWKPNDAARPY